VLESPEYKGKIRPKPDGDKRFSRASGGGSDTVIQHSLVQLSDDKVPSEIYRTAVASS
jgi:hypothetical protein